MDQDVEWAKVSYVLLKNWTWKCRQKLNWMIYEDYCLNIQRLKQFSLIISNFLSPADLIQWLQVSRLEKLAEKYGVLIKFCPKFHCELNPIKGLWCSQKLYVRQKTDQTFPTMLKLIVESRENFEQKKIHLKLFHRFWKSLLAYKNGQNYEEVMKMFFSVKCTGKVKAHTRISNTNLNL